MTDQEYYEGVCPYTHRHCDDWHCADCDEGEDFEEEWFEIETLEELAKSYKETCDKLEEKLNSFKEELREYNNNFTLNKDIYYLRKKIVVYEDMLNQTRYLYNVLKNYYRSGENETW